MKKVIPGISVFVLIAFLNMLIGCTYYRAKVFQPSQQDAGMIKEMKDRKYMILHLGEKVWLLKDIVISEDNKEMKATTEPLPADHLFYLHTKIPGANRYKPKQGSPTYEVHIYISEYAEGINSQIIVPLSGIKKIEIYDPDVGATVASYVFTTIGIIAGACVVLIVLVALLKSSCPFVYISDGQSFHFAGEMYGGAIYAPHERDDYMPLPDFMPTNGQYKLKISNELLERQYTNLAELTLVEHPENSTVLIDKNGNIQTILDPESPVSAMSGNNTDYTNPVLLKDSCSYLFNEDNRDSPELSSLALSFKKPLNAKSGKLILNAKNSFWLDYMYGKFNELFGTYYNKFAEKQMKATSLKNNNWSLEQGIPLSVYIETRNGWQFVDYYNPLGPLASRDLIMPVDLSEVAGDNVMIKLECGFMFWEIDFAAMDFSDNIPVKVMKMKPSSAIDENGKDVSALLSATDEKYLVQPEVGNEVTIIYNSSVASPVHKITPFFHSRGYYEYIRDYENKPDFEYLKTFRTKGAFTQFSKKHYFEYVNRKDLYSTALSK
jgi:hypothetical protein